MENFECVDRMLFLDFSAEDSNPLKFLTDLDFEKRVVLIRLSELAPLVNLDIFDPTRSRDFGVKGLEDVLYRLRAL